MCFDKTKNVIKESEHPFTTGYGTTDERITCHYYDHLQFGVSKYLIYFFCQVIILSNLGAKCL